MKVGFLGLLALLLIGLKLAGTIAWSWWLVLLPLYAIPAFVLGLAGLTLAAGGFVAAVAAVVGAWPPSRPSSARPRRRANDDPAHPPHGGHPGRPLRQHDRGRPVPAVVVRLRCPPRRRRKRREEALGLLCGLLAACLLYGAVGLLILLSGPLGPPTPAASPPIAHAR